MTYLGALSHGLIALDRDGRLIRWTLCAPAGVVTQHVGPPHQAHDAIRDWITSVTDDWTEQAELRRRALDIRYRIDHKETDQMSEPKRIQRKRAKGWRAPLCACGCNKPARYVGRGSAWGNPWRVGDRLMAYAGHEHGVQYARELVITPEIAVALARAVFALDRYAARAELAGHDLMCWCPLVDAAGDPVPCHADVLLELANKESDQ